MLIAAIRSGHVLAGKAVSYSEDDGKFWMTGVGEIAPERLLEHETAGELEWADDSVRIWVMGIIAGDATAPPPAPPSPAETAAPAKAAAKPKPESASPSEPGTAAGTRPEPAAKPVSKSTAEVFTPSADVTSSAGAAVSIPAAPPSPDDVPEAPRPEVIPARRLTRQAAARPDFVEAKKERWKPSDAQWRVIAYTAIAIAAITAVVLLAVFEFGGSKQKAGTGGGWTEVVKLSGTSSGNSDTFTLSGSQQKLVFETSRSAPNVQSTFAVALVPKGVAPTRAGDFGVTQGVIDPQLAAGTMSRTVMLTKPPGDYFVVVTTDNCTWTVTVSDFR